jgi:hypothetical protein
MKLAIILGLPETAVVIFIATASRKRGLKISLSNLARKQKKDGLSDEAVKSVHVLRLGLLSSINKPCN